MICPHGVQNQHCSQCEAERANIAKLVRHKPRLVIEESADGAYVLYESHLASVSHLLKALRLIADCTPIPGPGFSLEMSMVSIANRALSLGRA